MHDLQLPQKGFWKIIQLKFKDDPVWLDRVWHCCLCFSISHNLWLLDLLNYAAICGIMFCLRSGETCIIWHRNWQKSEIWRIAEIMGRPENFHIQGGPCPLRGRSENFHFQGWACPVRGGWFSRRFIPLCILCSVGFVM